MTVRPSSITREPQAPIKLASFRFPESSMPLTDLVAPNAIIPALKVNSKKQALQELAARAAELSGQNERAILEILLQREKLGSTAVGNGIAIPHGKLPKLGRLFGLFARLERPIDFEALDGQPVDLIFLAARAGRRRRRSSQGAGARRAPAARSRDRPQAARLARCRCALRRAGDAVRFRRVATCHRPPTSPAKWPVRRAPAQSS